MMDQMLRALGERYPLTARDPGEFAAFKAKGMRFTVWVWEAEGLGHVSAMRATGFLGLMKMQTLIVNPREIDLPLYSYDRIHASGNDMLIAELYDTTVGGFASPALDRVLSEAIPLPERDPGRHWYDEIRLQQSLSKKGKQKKYREAFDRTALAHFKAWLSTECPLLEDKAVKQKKTADYVNGLLEHGGPSTDVFLHAFGEQKTTALFRRVLFGLEA